MQLGFRVTSIDEVAAALDGLDISYQLPGPKRLVTVDPDGNRVHVAEVRKAGSLNRVSSAECHGTLLHRMDTAEQFALWRAAWCVLLDGTLLAIGSAARPGPLMYFRNPSAALMLFRTHPTAVVRNFMRACRSESRSTVNMFRIGH